MSIRLLDCTLRDGGYHNAWDFPIPLIEDYLQAMAAISVDYVEIGFRSLKRVGFKGGCAYSTDTFISALNIPENLKLGVMVNAGEIVNHPEGAIAFLSELFAPAAHSPVTLVRLACHVHEFADALPAVTWLKEQGYVVGVNLMQVANHSEAKIVELAELASNYPLDVLYFADSMGSLNPEATSRIINLFRLKWSGDLGIHTHDNMGQAIANTVRAVKDGVTWVDGTVTGMGRGPGNAQTEYLVLELATQRNKTYNVTSLLATIRNHFRPLKSYYGWGKNPYYYLAGKYAIHPIYIQEMLTDSRYKEEDILAVIDHLKNNGGGKFNLATLESARYFYQGEPGGQWSPAETIQGRDVLIIGTGPGVEAHRTALEIFIKRRSPFVIALNVQRTLNEDLIDIRAACHPVRLLADCHDHNHLPQPLATPASMLPKNILDSLTSKRLFDFGLSIQPGTFQVFDTYAILPNALVVAYAIALATSGRAARILLAGFDGYGADDPRRKEVDATFCLYQKSERAIPLLAITPTLYELSSTSVYALIE